MAFAERPLRLQPLGIDQALDHDFGVGRHFEIDRHGLGRRIGYPASAPATPISSLVDGKLLRARERDHRRAADHDGAGHGLLAARYFCQCR